MPGSTRPRRAKAKGRAPKKLEVVEEDTSHELGQSQAIEIENQLIDPEEQELAAMIASANSETPPNSPENRPMSPYQTFDPDPNPETEPEPEEAPRVPPQVPVTAIAFGAWLLFAWLKNKL